jgi:hypothetical protein
MPSALQSARRATGRGVPAHWCPLPCRAGEWAIGAVYSTWGSGAGIYADKSLATLIHHINKVNPHKHKGHEPF